MSDAEITHYKRFISLLVARKKPFSSEDEKAEFVANFVGDDADLDTNINRLIKNNLRRSSNPMWTKGDDAMIERIAKARENFQVKEAAAPTVTKRKAPAAQAKKSTRRQPQIRVSPVADDGNEEGNDEVENEENGNDREEETAPPQRKRRANDKAVTEQEEEAVEEEAPAPKKKAAKGRKAAPPPSEDNDGGATEEQAEENEAPPAPKRKATKTKKDKKAAAPIEEEDVGEPPEQETEEDEVPLLVAAPPVPEHFDEVADETNEAAIEQIPPAEAPNQMAEILAVLQDLRTQVREEQQAFKEEVFAKMEEFKQDMITALENLAAQNGPTVGDTLQENMIPIKTEPQSATRPPPVPRHY